MIDVHGHFYTARSGRGDWREWNRRRLEAGERMGITAVVASILGSWGRRSPTYFPSPDDVTHANDEMLAITDEHQGTVFGYCVVNPNYGAHAVAEIERCIERGMIGIKLAASRRADDPLLDPIAEAAAAHHRPILHHIWQHRRRDWPGQEASDAGELATLARRHPDARFILAHLGGGGDWAHSVRAVQPVPNIWVDLCGSGIDADMLRAALAYLGPERLVWGTDLTMETGWAKLRYLAALGLPEADLERIRAGNAGALFPEGAFDAGD